MHDLKFSSFKAWARTGKRDQADAGDKK